MRHAILLRIDATGHDVQHEQPWKQMMHLCGQPSSGTNVFTP